MPQTPVSVSAFFSSATPSTVYTVGAGKTAIINNVQVASLLGSTVNVTLNKVATDGTVYPIAVDRRSGDDVNYWTSSNATTSPANMLKGSLTLSAGESLSLSTSTSASFKFPQTYTGNGILNQVYYGDGRYIVVGRNDDNSKGLVLTSTDGQSWTRQTFPFAYTLNDVAATTGRIIAISGSYTTGYFTSTDGGVTWTQVAGLSGGHSGAPVGISYGNSTWVIFGNNFIYTSSDGTTWTLNSAFTTYLGGYNPSLKNATWDGTRWLFTTNYGMIHANAAFTTFTSPGFIRGGMGAANILYHPASSKFYATLGLNDAANYIVTSTDGINWTNTTVGTAFGQTSTPSHIISSGATSQTLVMPQSNDARRGLYSTNSGSTWTQYTNNNISTPAKSLYSLGNGYYIQFSQYAYNWYIGCCPYLGYFDGYVAVGNTPWTFSQTSTGASYNVSQGDFWIGQSASSTGADNGPWIVFGGYYSQSYQIMSHYNTSGSNGWNMSANYLRASGYNFTTYGTPISSVFFNNKFWMITTTGYLFSINNSLGSNLTYVTRVCQGSNGIAVINNRLVVTNTSSASTKTVFFSTDGTNWIGTTVVNNGAFPNNSVTNPFATNGTNNAIMINGSYQICQSTDGESWSSIPSGMIETSIMNGNTFGQSLIRNSSFSSIGYGTYYITNPTSLNGFTRISNSTSSYETLPNVMVYANSSYFFTNPLALLSTPTSTFTSAGVASNSVNGQTFMSAYELYAAASNGSGAVVIDARSTQSNPVYKLGYVANVNFARSVAAAAISILEIS